MITAFFHDERFTRDASGAYHGTGALPYATFARYLRHFDRVVVVGRLGAPGDARRTPAGGPGVEFACIETAGRSAPAYLAAAARRVREVLAVADCAIIRMPSTVGALACREAVRTGKPWLVEVVADAFDVLWNHGSVKGKAAAIVMYLLNRHYIRQARFALYVTRETLQRRYPSGGTWTFASNVVVETPRPDTLERRLARIALRRPGTPAVLGLVGSYDVAYKGHETALRALALLHRPDRPVTLRCIGVGAPERWRARAAALGVGQRVALGPALPQGPSVLEWMDALDVLVVPSLTEGLPRSLVEAMSRALPAVGSRAGGIPELLAGPALHRAGDARDLARALEHLLGDPAAMAESARRNWSAAHAYAADVLERRRDALARAFRVHAEASRRTAPQPVASGA